MCIRNKRNKEHEKRELRGNRVRRFSVKGERVRDLLLIIISCISFFFYKALNLKQYFQTMFFSLLSNTFVTEYDLNVQYVFFYLLTSD